jgi:hypothetical protein
VVGIWWRPRSKGRAAPSARGGDSRLRTLGGCAGPPALRPWKAGAWSVSLCRSAISLVDRDLVSQDLLLVVVPGMRLRCLARAGARARAALRAHRERERGHAAGLPSARPARARAALRAHREGRAAPSARGGRLSFAHARRVRWAARAAPVESTRLSFSATQAQNEVWGPHRRKLECARTFAVAWILKSVMIRAGFCRARRARVARADRRSRAWPEIRYRPSARRGA